MLSYLAAALPENTSAAARLLALQCALRMNTHMRVRLSKGVMRSLRLNAASGPWHELEHARWLRTTPGGAANEIAAELLDLTLLGQAPARPDRRRAADWALRASSSSAVRAIGPLPRLASVYLAASTDPESGTGLGDLEQMARACGTRTAELLGTLDQLVAAGLLGSWQACPDSGDLQWTSSERRWNGPQPRSRHNSPEA
ncbi:hypothetical protein [Streptomyces griseoaurantiacus]|uniref:hypothetical protein n=1 Tax=Streptomyces griseoaurantiacus TaxID=68213 RepID=UPI0019A56848|nr:hypothetical protein GCM10018782_57540 [Streptomyces griseoaurantiacus]